MPQPWRGRVRDRCAEEGAGEGGGRRSRFGLGACGQRRANRSSATADAETLVPITSMARAGLIHLHPLARSRCRLIGVGTAMQGSDPATNRCCRVQRGSSICAERHRPQWVVGAVNAARVLAADGIQYASRQFSQRSNPSRRALLGARVVQASRGKSAMLPLRVLSQRFRGTRLSWRILI